MAKKTKKVYSFKVPGLYGDLSAEDAAKELEKIRKKHGELQPEYVVEEAKNEKSILHGCFCWDDTVAAARYREHQARCLVNNIRVEVKTTKIECNVKAFVNVVQTFGNPRSYVPISVAMANDVAYNDLMQQAKEEMSNFIAKYQQLTELEPVRAVMQKYLK